MWRCMTDWTSITTSIVVKSYQNTSYCWEKKNRRKIICSATSAVMLRGVTMYCWDSIQNNNLQIENAFIYSRQFIWFKYRLFANNSSEIMFIFIFHVHYDQKLNRHCFDVSSYLFFIFLPLLLNFSKNIMTFSPLF